MILAVLSAGLFGPIALPYAPVNGLGIASGGRWFMSSVAKEGSASICALNFDGKSVKQISNSKEKFSSDLQLFGWKGGVYVADFENERASLLDSSLNLVWKIDIGPATNAKLDDKGRLWLLTGGYISIKSDESSTAEPLLEKNGGEVFVPGLFDVEPTDKGYYAVISNGNIIFRTYSGQEKLLAKIPGAQQVIRTNNSLVIFASLQNAQSIWKLSSGAKKQLWRREANFPIVDYIVRNPDGRIVLAANKNSSGVAYILNPEAK